MANTFKIADKTDDTLTLEGYIAIWGDENTLDADGEYFHSGTDFKSTYTENDTVLVDWEHGLKPDRDVEQPGRDDPLGRIQWLTAQKDNIGLLARAVLNRRLRYVRDFVEPLAAAGLLGGSSEAIPDRVRKNGAAIDAWPLRRHTLTVSPADPRQLSEYQYSVIKSLSSDYPALKSMLPQVAEDATAEATGDAEIKINEGKTMTEQKEQVDLSPVLDAVEKISDMVKAFDTRLTELEKDAPADNALTPATKNVNVVTNVSDWVFDNYSTQDIALTMAVIKSAEGRQAVSDNLTRAFYRRLESAEAAKNKGLQLAQRRMKSMNIKADETNFSTNTSYGDEWIGVAYSSDLWDKVRVNTFVLDALGRAGSIVAAPPGAESVVFPIEGTDNVWYTVAQAGDPSSATAQVTNTVPAKALGTGSVTASLAKSGTSVIYTGEMVEDAVLPFVETLRARLVVSGAENMEAILINGDTEAGATTNINDIAGTAAATDWFMAANGFRKLCLVTNTANSRDGGALASADFIDTVKLMGNAGIGGLDPMKLGFILDPYTHYKAIQLADVKSLDVFTGATIESGRLASIFGSPVYVSGQMHKGATNLLANSAGKIDLDTQGNNTTGAILAVRWDQWRFGYRRDLTIESMRFPRADAWEITALMRFHVSARDNEASAISYNLTV